MMIVIVSVVIGFSREYSAETAAAALQARIRTRSTVVRDRLWHQHSGESVASRTPGSRRRHTRSSGRAMVGRGLASAAREHSRPPYGVYGRAREPPVRAKANRGTHRCSSNRRLRIHAHPDAYGAPRALVTIPIVTVRMAAGLVPLHGNKHTPDHPECRITGVWRSGNGLGQTSSRNPPHDCGVIRGEASLARWRGALSSVARWYSNC
jgi:hypothetical protein